MKTWAASSSPTRSASTLVPVVSTSPATGPVRWMSEDQISFMTGAAQDVMHTGEEHGFSSFGSLFMAAQASLESGWGQGNWMDETHNLFSMMGGFEILVPETWRVISEVTPFMGGIEDKSRTSSQPTAPCLVLRGFMMMGGVTIKNS